jgi:uncharacterized protein (DUF736 family)
LWWRIRRRDALRRPRARNGSGAIFFPCADAHSSRSNKIAPPPSFALLRAQGLQAGRRGASNRHQGPRWARVQTQVQEITMAQIGNFKRGEDGSYVGTIRTLALNAKARIMPAESSQNEKAPDLRVFVGSVEIGAAWKRTSQENTVYHSVKLDDPSFPAPIFANLVEVDGAHVLIWSR